MNNFKFRNGSVIWTHKVVCHLRRHPVSGHELDTLILVAKEQKSHVSSGEQIAHATLAGTQDSSNPTQDVPFVEYSTGEQYKPKAGHEIVSFWIQFKSRTQILYLRKGE